MRGGAVLAPAVAGVWLLSLEEELARPRTSAAPAGALPVPRTTVAALAPAQVERPTTPEAEQSRCAAAPLASDTLAALPSSRDAQVVDAVEAESRSFLGQQLIEWLALEDHPAGALMQADQIGELGAWLAPVDRERLLGMVREDPLEARRRAAFVALGYLRPASAAHVELLVEAFSSRPTEEARLGLLEALLMLRQAGADVSGSLELALDARFGAPSPEAQALVATGDPRAIR